MDRWMIRGSQTLEVRTQGCMPICRSTTCRTRRRECEEGKDVMMLVMGRPLTQDHDDSRSIFEIGFFQSNVSSPTLALGGRRFRPQ